MWPWDRKVQLLMLLLAAALMFAGGARYGQWLVNRSQDAKAPVVTNAEGQGAGLATGVPAGQITVQVAGAVSKPRVYTLPSSSRVIDALNMAGLLPEADIGSLNLARQLVDGEKINVLRQGETPAGATNGSQGVAPAPAGTTVGAASQQGDKLNINTATAEELDAKLPGIGPTLAKRIVDYRTSHGSFKTVEDLRSVSGIGPRRFDQIKEYVTI
ncbi:MAG: ComEA family DNA-binding protein [Thermacetogeniaceae bacterium]